MNNVEKVTLNLYETFNRRDFKAIPEVFAANCKITDTTNGQVYEGHDGAKKWLQLWSGLSSDMKAEPKVVACSDTVCVIEGNANGRNDGPIQTPQGTLPATNRKLNMIWVDLVEVKNDRVTGIRCYYDTARMMNQLGVSAQPQRSTSIPAY
jgi:ketosteroid isomerase-like protein